MKVYNKIFWHAGTEKNKHFHEKHTVVALRQKLPGEDILELHHQDTGMMEFPLWQFSLGCHLLQENKIQQGDIFSFMQ